MSPEPPEGPPTSEEEQVLALMRTLLLAHGARVDATGPDGKTALTSAAMFDWLECLEVLLAHGADAAHRDAAGRTALDAARAMGAPRTASRLEGR
jgi:ankyrin repeat protein